MYAGCTIIVASAAKQETAKPSKMGKLAKKHEIAVATTKIKIDFLIQLLHNIVNIFMLFSSIKSDV